VIEQLKAEKLKMASDLATELRELAEEEANRLQLAIQAAEIDKQMLRQTVQNLAGVVELLRITTVKSVDEFLNRLKLDLNCITNG
jgi:hypothetical protein